MEKNNIKIRYRRNKKMISLALSLSLSCSYTHTLTHTHRRSLNCLFFRFCRPPRFHASFHPAHSRAVFSLFPLSFTASLALTRCFSLTPPPSCFKRDPFASQSVTMYFLDIVNQYHPRYTTPNSQSPRVFAYTPSALFYNPFFVCFF